MSQPPIVRTLALTRYNPPPNWPQPPAGWAPAPGWQPDPAWGPAPAGWPLWLSEAPSRWGWFTRHKLVTGAGIVALIAMISASVQAGGTSPAVHSQPRGPGVTAASSSTTSASAPTSSANSTSASAKPGTALAALAVLPVKGRAPMTNYSRDEFGQAWLDVDRNGCDTRNDVLRRDLTALTLKAGTNGCLVLSGTLHDPYTDRTLLFVRGAGTSNAVQIDHVVALGDAWQTGAQQLSLVQREGLANDPLNLLAVDAPNNLAKGDSDAASWLPPAHTYRCSYVARQIAVKRKYHLWVTSSEKVTMAGLLSTCPAKRMPTARPIALGGGKLGFVSQPSTSHTTTGLDPRFSTCAGANSHGYGPYYRGKDPEYYWYRDRDDDGIDCEP